KRALHGSSSGHARESPQPGSVRASLLHVAEHARGSALEPGSRQEGPAALRGRENLRCEGRGHWQNRRAAGGTAYFDAGPLRLAEVDYDCLLQLNLAARAFRPFSKFPAVERDFSLLVPQGVRYSQLVEALCAARVEEVSQVRPVERLPEGKIEPGFYSLLLRVN